MTHPKGLRLANETYARAPLMQAISEGCEMQALMEEIAALKAENKRLKTRLEATEEGLTAAYSCGRHDAMKGGAA